MRAVAELGRLWKQCARRLVCLRAFVEACQIPVSSEEDRVISYVTIEGVNLWASFVREYYVSCALGARCMAGARVTIAVGGIRNSGDAITFAIRYFMSGKKGPPWQRRDEPVWYRPNTLLQLMQALGTSNMAQVRAGFGYQTPAFTHMPTFRNFFAHRNEETARKVATIASYYGLSSAMRPSGILRSRSWGRPQSVLADWLDDIRQVVGLLCR